VRPLLEREEEADPLAAVRHRIRCVGVLALYARCGDEARQLLVELRQRGGLELVLGRREQPANVQCDDEVDDGILATRTEAGPLDLDPARVVDDADLGIVVLAVAAVVVGDAANERVERQRRTLAPLKRDRGREARVIRPREDQRAALRAKHQAARAAITAWTSPMPAGPSEQ